MARKTHPNPSIEKAVFMPLKVTKMNEYEFVLRFQLPEGITDSEEYLDALYEAGCDDAMVGVGLPGYIGLDFSREATSATEAVISAIRDVKKAIPGAKLMEATPDLLNISEIADFISPRLQKMTRQAIRKYAFGHVAKVKSRFPAAAVSSSSPLWHLDEVVTWLVENNKADKFKAQRILETSKITRAVNLKLQAQSINAEIQEEIDINLTEKGIELVKNDRSIDYLDYVRQETLERLLSFSAPVATVSDPYAEGQVWYLVIAIDPTAPVIREVPANTAGAYKTLADAKEAARQILQTAIAQAKESLSQLRQVGIDNISYISL